MSKPSVDPEGDPVRYRFAWTRNGARKPFAETSDELPARLLDDGDASGPVAASAEVVIAPTQVEQPVSSSESGAAGR